MQAKNGIFSLLAVLAIGLIFTYIEADNKQRWFVEKKLALSVEGLVPIPGTDSRRIDLWNPWTWSGYTDQCWFTSSKAKGMLGKMGDTVMILRVKSLTEDPDIPDDEFWVVFSKDRKWSIMEGEPPLDGEDVQSQLSEIIKNQGVELTGKKIGQRFHQSILKFLALK